MRKLLYLISHIVDLSFEVESKWKLQLEVVKNKDLKDIITINSEVGKASDMMWLILKLGHVKNPG
jgi:hypothetical protein